MKRNSLFFIIILSILIPAFISATIPETLNLHGRLTNSSGNVLTGTYNMTFRIYNVSSGGNTLYEFANQSITTDSGGIYHIILGNVNLTFDEQYYLGITIENDSEMIPRINLTSFPYTFRAKNISAEGIINDSNLNLEGYNVTGSSGLFNYLGDVLNKITKIFAIDVELNGTLNVSNFFFANGSNVGIGTISPTHTLTVNGTLNVTGTSYLGNIVISADNITTNNIISKTGNISFFNSTNSEIVRFLDDGRVGIGTASPDGILDVDAPSGVAIQYLQGNFPLFRIVDKGEIDPAGRWGIYSDSGNLNIFEYTSANFVAGSNRLTIQNVTGSVGIGTTSPDKRFEVEETNAATTTTTGIMVTNPSTTGNSRAGIVFKNYDNPGAAIWSPRTGSAAGNLIFATNNGTGVAETNVIERMVLNQFGNFGIGATGGPGLRLEVEDTASSQVARFQDSDAICDAQPTGGGMTWSCASDERLKENIVPSTFNALDYINKIPLFDYTLKKTGKGTMGWVAQEMLKAGYSELVSNQTDFNSLTNQTETFLSVSEISQPIIIKSIQELYLENLKLKAELCLKDKTYSWCK